MKQALILFLLILPFSPHAQNIKSLWKDFYEGTSAERVKACDELARYYKSEARDTMKVIGEDLFMYGIDQHYYPAIERGKLTLAEYFVLSGKTADGIAMTKALLPNMEERGDDHMLAFASSVISMGYIRQKDAKSAFYWAQKAEREAAADPDPLVRAEPLLVLAEAYQLKNNAGDAIKTFRKYIRILTPYHKYRSVSAAYARIGDIYRIQGDLTKAESHFRQSMDFARKSGRTTPIAHAMNNLAIIYFEKGDTLQSRQYFEKAMALREKTGDAQAVSESYYNMGDYHFYISKNDDASRWYMRSLEVARKNNLHHEQADALRALAMVARSTEDFEGANGFLESYIGLMDEIQLRNSSDDEEIASLQHTITRLEAEVKVANSSFDPDEDRLINRLRWEWGAIALLLSALIYLGKRKKQGGSAAPLVHSSREDQ